MKGIRHRGWTLIELMAVVGISTILMMLTMPVLSRGARQARMTSCSGNERQLLLALRMYAEDTHAYPQMAYFQKGAVVATWTDILARYSTPRRADSVFVCPDYRRMGGVIKAEDGYAYGYNTAGVAGWPYTTRPQFGLGGLNNGDLDAIVPTREAEVVKPEDMLALADAVLHCEYYGDGQLYGSIDLSAGLWDVRYDFSQSNASARAMNKRHGGRFETGFCDGHIETFSDQLFRIEDDRVLRKWNTDNQPHREAYYPSLRNP